MKLKAISLFEIIFVMTLMTVLSIFAITTYKANTPDQDIVKFKQIYGTVSTVVDSIVSNPAYYPDASGFLNREPAIISSTGVTVDNKQEKFSKIFKSYFNILEDNSVTINYTPLYSKTTVTYISKTKCFTDNRAITYCPPILSATAAFDNIYLRIHMNEAFEIKDALFFEITKNGKLTLPTRIPNTGKCVYALDGSATANCSAKGDFNLINCGDISYSNYMQCKILESLNKL